MLVAIAPGAEALEQTFGYRQFGTAQLDGFKGRQGIRTDPATVTGIGYVHPTQMDIGSVGAAFVAIGTAKGVGVDDCANDYDALWTVYIDGEIGGTYFCEDVDVDAYGSGTNPAFNISYEFCPSVLANRWLLSFGGVLWSCKSAGATGATRAIGMIETTGSSSTDRNIDVKYTNLQLNNISSNTWNNFGNAASSVAPNYSFANVSTTAFNVFLAPLD
jgi:hypothetical protein